MLLSISPACRQPTHTLYPLPSRTPDKARFDPALYAANGWFGCLGFTFELKADLLEAHESGDAWLVEAAVCAIEAAHHVAVTKGGVFDGVHSTE